MGLKDRIKKQLFYQKEGWKVAGRRIKASLKASIAEARANQAKKRELMQKLRKAEKEGMEAAMIEEARKIGHEKAEARARSLLTNKGFTIRMPDLGLGDFGSEERKQKKNNHN